MAAGHPAALTLVIHGAAGRVGRLLLDAVASDPRFHCVTALVRPGSPLLASPVWPGSALHFSDHWPAQADVVVDFSLPPALPGLFDEVRARRCALVSGTTGLDANDRERLQALGGHVPVLWASNFSLGALVLTELAAQARRWLPAGFEAAIVEAHHSAKRDAPSGTALSLAHAVADADPTLPVPPTSSLRAGTIVGDHTVHFAGPAERLELTHRAQDRSVFARGALDAAAWLAGRDPGLYPLRALLGAGL